MPPVAALSASSVSSGAVLVAAKPARCSVSRPSFLGANLRQGHRQASLTAHATPRHHRVLATQILTGNRGDVISSIVDFLRRLIPSANKPEAAVDPMQGDDEALAADRRVVVVVGGTGRVGRHIVSQLAAEGHAVVALVASRARAEEVLVQEQGVQLLGEDAEAPRPGKVYLVQGDIGDSAAVQRALESADAVVCSVGGRVNPPSKEGGFPGYAPGSSPEAVYGLGVPALLRAALEAFKGGESGEQEQVLFDFQTLGLAEAQGEGETEAAEAAAPRAYVDGWGRFDDVIMGGKSESVLQPGQGSAVFQGTLRVEGGGFCASRTAFSVPLDLSSFDGLRLRVRGDGRRYKVNLRDTKSSGEFQYQASFDTFNGQWLDAMLPFTDFRAVERSRLVVDPAPIDANEIRTLGIVYSRFQCDGFPNPLFMPGEFKLEIASISAYRAARPQFVLVSSAAVQRSARAQTAEEREASIPIVKLNPGGVLSWKLSCEDAVCASGLRYTVVRPTGLLGPNSPKADTINKEYLLESAQGDVLTGLISCSEAAAVCVKALDSPDAVQTTFEVRRDDLTEGISMTDRHWADLFQRLRPDARNGRVQYPSVPRAMSEAFKG